MTDDIMAYNSTTLFSNNTIINDTTCVADNRSDIEFYNAHIPSVMKVYYLLPPIWWCVGIIGNILALIVWLQPKMRHSSGCYLAALAITDLCFLPLNIVYEINHIYTSAEESILDKDGLCQFFAVAYYSVQYMSPVLVLAFTVERYLSVCHPFRMVNVNESNIRVSVLVILGLMLFCIGINGVQGYFWTIHDGKCSWRPDVLASEHWGRASWALEMLIFAVVPLTVLILNILVIVEVRKISSLERRNMRTNSIDRRSTTLMLLGVSFYLIFTVLPVTIIYVLFSTLFLPGKNRFELCLTDEQMDADPEWRSYFQCLGAKLIIQNIGASHYAANFFVYVGTGKLFRKQLKELFVMFCCKEQLHYLSSKTRAYSNTRTTRMSLMSHRGSVARGRTSGSKASSDPCNNDTEVGNKNVSGTYSAVDPETSTMNGGHGVTQNAAGTKLLTCVEESDGDISDREDGQTAAAASLTL